MERKKLYVGCMNDAVFVIDVMPRQAPVDYVNTSLPAPEICIPFGTDFDGAEKYVAEHNARL